jgi:hypothetical protein
MPRFRPRAVPLKSIAAGVDPILVKEVQEKQSTIQRPFVEELRREEREIRERLRRLVGPTDAMRLYPPSGAFGSTRMP